MSRSYTKLSSGWLENILMCLRLALVGAAIIACTNKTWSVVFAALGTVGLTFLPRLLMRPVKIHLPAQYELAISIFIIATVFLGEAGDSYNRFWWWDAVLHGLSSFAIGFAGFLALYVLLLPQKPKVGPYTFAIFAFASGLALGAIWEIFEFAMDQTFGINMQKNGLQDTMSDLIIDAIGAGLAAVNSFLYIRYNAYDPFDTFVAWFLKANPRFRSKL